MPQQIRGSGSSVNPDLASVSLAMLGGRHDIYTPSARLASLVKLTIFSNEKNNLHLLIAEFGLFVLRAEKKVGRENNIWIGTAYIFMNIRRGDGNTAHSIWTPKRHSNGVSLVGR